MFLDRRVILPLLIAALFSLGCVTVNLVTDVLRTDSGQNQIGLTMGFEFDKKVYAALNEGGSSSSDYSSMEKQGWKVNALEGGRVVTFTKSLAPLEKLSPQDWKIKQQKVGDGQIITATLNTGQVFGSSSQDQDNALKDLMVEIDETDPNAPRYTYQATIVVPKKEEPKPDEPPPSCGASETTDLNCFFFELSNDPKLKKL